MSGADADERRQRAAGRGEHEAPPAPEPLPLPVVDSHTHLDLVSDAGGGDPAAQLAAAAAVGVDRVVQVGVDLPSSRWASQLAAEHPQVLATVGVHPNEAPRLGDGLDEALREVERLAAAPRVRGVGETGLDTFRTGPEGAAAQEASFRGHIAIAKRFGKALIIHDREAHAEVLRVLDDEGAPDRVVMHCFSGDAEFADECLRRGFVLSFAGTVTFRNARSLREAARRCPPDRLLVETDAPYLTPHPYRGRRNGPYLIPVTVRGLAEARGVELAPLCRAISDTGEWVFGGWGGA
ncbi:TatD family hydrolase [Natronosporangium hydrolyticum]|uniref:TatD family hydrolase n=1 Tax=Natronosporangium hydrolyticum TaxID=2811111 RepID=A0A895YMV7_9ACTN|nr:TatD family hydrolase [Natronosporangium hydrolyticum]QSB15440.1 TatD family hydrolase [Natronosporangium hydrolyticum]